jgi:hypothetical protein
MEPQGPEYRYVGNMIEIIPPGHWRTLNEWVYVSVEDPYCYIELIYDNWWWEKSTPKEHCVKQMTEKGCSLIGMHKHPQEWKILGFKNTEDCVGIKGSRREITHSLNGWKQVHEYVPVQYRYLGVKSIPVTIHGTLLAYADGREFKQITPLYRKFGLWYGKTYNNAILENGTRTWIQPHWLVVMKANSLRSLVRKSTWLSGNRETTQYVEPSRGTCNTIVTDGKFENIMGTIFTTKIAIQQGYVQITCGEKLCDCDSLPISVLRHAKPETEVVVDHDEGIFTGALKWVERTCLKVFNWLIDTLIGGNWQIKILSWGLIYYITSQTSRSVGAGVVVAIVVAYNMLKE